LVGGVAANKFIREVFKKTAEQYDKKIVIPRLEFCGDNAAMIAFRGQKLYEAGEVFNLNYPPFPALPENLYSI
jgi:N6-L-threonylcarbamoyladenine synthase